MPVRAPFGLASAGGPLAGEAASLPSQPALDERHTRRADEILNARLHDTHVRTDRMFALLMVVQWIAGIGVAYWISPRTWAGTAWEVHPHVWAALLLGA